MLNNDVFQMLDAAFNENVDKRTARWHCADMRNIRSTSLLDLSSIRLFDVGAIDCHRSGYMELTKVSGPDFATPELVLRKVSIEGRSTSISLSIEDLHDILALAKKMALDG